MPVGEMCRQMTAQELTVDWPLFFQYRERERQRQEQAEANAPRTLG